MVLQWNLDTTKGQGTIKMCLLLRGFVISRFFFIYFTTNNQCCKSEVYMKHHPNSSLKNLLSALAS